MLEEGKKKRDLVSSARAHAPVTRLKSETPGGSSSQKRDLQAGGVREGLRAAERRGLVGESSHLARLGVQRQYLDLRLEF